MQVRDIIKANMTTLKFAYSKDFAEAYFQHTCYRASAQAYLGEFGRHHPYSFNTMRSFVKRINTK